MSFERLQNLSSQLFSLEQGCSERVLPAVHIFQREKVSAFEAIVYNPVICLILQGKKEMNLGVQFIIHPTDQD